MELTVEFFFCLSSGPLVNLCSGNHRLSLPLSLKKERDLWVGQFLKLRFVRKLCIRVSLLEGYWKAT